MTNLDQEESCIIDKALAALMEHFDTAQILVTKDLPNEGCTLHIESGRGNLFARLGHAQAWLDANGGFDEDTEN